MTTTLNADDGSYLINGNNALLSFMNRKHLNFNIEICRTSNHYNFIKQTSNHNLYIKQTEELIIERRR